MCFSRRLGRTKRDKRHENSGGWVDFELELLQRHGFHLVSLGRRIFTTEVAVVSLVTLAQDALETRVSPLARLARRLCCH